MRVSQSQINMLKGIGDIADIGGEVLGGIGAMEAYDYNAQLAQISAGEAAISGEFEQTDIEAEEVSLLATQHVEYAKAGVTQSGSPLEVELETATEFEMEKSIAKYNNEVLQKRYEAQAAQDKYARKMAGYSMIAGIGKTLMGAGESFMGVGAKK